MLAKEGLNFTDKNGDPRARPEVAIERATPALVVWHNGNATDRETDHVSQV